MKIHWLTDIILHAVILIAVGYILIHDGVADDTAALRHAEWQAHEQAMMAREAQREVFFEKWSKALQSAECEATVIEAIKGMERRR